jgi:hypothetical protein
MTCPLFVELCAGTAAVSLRLHGGPHARPPVSRMGAKTGYAHAILHALGLRQGQGHADGTRYLWCEPDAGVRLLLHAYTDRDLATAAAAIIRSWRDEDPRALWERLRAEGPAVCPDGGMDAREVARWVLTGLWAYRKGQPESGFNAAHVDGQSSTDTHHGSGPRTVHMEAAGLDTSPTIPATIRTDARTVDPREVARWAWVKGHEDMHGRDVAPQYQPGAELRDTWKPPPRDWLASRLDTSPTIPATIRTDARTVDPREVARWITVGQLSYRQMEPASGFNPGMATDSASPCWRPGLASVAGAVCAQTIPATTHDDARTIEPARLPPGTVAYMDPPYQDTTGYGHLFPREEVVEVARRWRDAGALVCVSEAVPIPELVADGWHTLDITETRKGQKRTFSKQQREWLTMSEAPKWRPSVARDLFSRGEG